MDPVILGIFVTGVVVTIFLPRLLTRLTSQKERLEQMDGPKLIQLNMHAAMMKGRLRLAAYVTPLPVIIAVRCFSQCMNQRLIIGVAFVIVFACLASAQYFGEIDNLSTAEMESRKDEKSDIVGQAGDEKDPPAISGTL